MFMKPKKNAEMVLEVVEKVAGRRLGMLTSGDSPVTLSTKAEGNFSDEMETHS